MFPHQLIRHASLVSGPGQAVELLVLGVELQPVAVRQLRAVAIPQRQLQVARVAVLRVEECVLQRRGESIFKLITIISWDNLHMAI